MDARPRGTNAERSYEDFLPSSELIKEKDSDTLVLFLPEFKKEQLRLQLDTAGNLKISGERPSPSDQNKWIRFQREFQVSENYSLTDMRAKFENEKLTVLMPKIIVKPSKESPTSQGTEEVAKTTSMATPTAAPVAGDTHAGRKTTIGEKQMNGHTYAENSTDGMENTEEEDQEYDDSAEIEARRTGGEEILRGGGMILVLDQSRPLILNAVVAFAVGMALGVYVAYQFAQAAEH